jgi:methyl-accepting chemotaxis protein
MISVFNIVNPFQSFSGRSSRVELESQLAAIGSTMAVTQFSLDGRILGANENILKLLGYRLDEVQGQHHGIFVDALHRSSPEYKQFWDKLGRGEHDAGQYKRLSKDGREVWLQAAYHPVFNASGKLCKVVEYVSDITEEKVRSANLEGQLAAINRVMGVIEFSLDGRILAANDNFLKMLGYRIDEVKGKHHSLFVDALYRSSPEYRQFWDGLARGQYAAGQYKRIGKDGKEIWVQASYNPIFDASGKPFKVVKYATDVTAQKLRNADFEGQMAAINRVMGVIEFSLDGRILDANENFLKTLGYSLPEIKGQHHRLFVDDDYRQSPEYRAFWQKLGHGEFDAGQYKRIGKGGREIWIQASYNPIFDSSGKPLKIVKYAADITEQVKANQAMKEMVARATEIAETVESAAREISAGNGNLSSRTESQAASVEETASSMEELASAVKQNSDNAARANQLAVASSAAAEQGNKVVGDMVSTMSNISASNDKIADIIGVIDGIAFQTNILSLNAAVEAARAGEQGRGFAVVASEVRNLAQRCATSAKEVRALIGDASEKIKIGTNLVDQAGTTMKELQKAVTSVNDTIADIAAASREQSAGIEQINRAIMSVDESTQQNAALVEEIAAASRSLEEQASMLFELVTSQSTQAKSDANSAGKVVTSDVLAAHRARRSVPRSAAA